jgi:hypothetical protein
MHPAQQLATDLSFNTFSAFEDASVGHNVQALSRPRQSLDVAARPAQHQFLQPFHIHPYPARWLADYLHLLQHRLAVPVFHS